MCLKHNQPIYPSHWKKGRRTGGCSKCKSDYEKSRSKAVIVPSPEKRLCVKHNRPIMPSQWRRGHKRTGCSKCRRERMRSPATKSRRELKWQKQFIFCIRHPNRRCNRSTYVMNGMRRCGSCIVRSLNGHHKPAYERVLRKNRYNKSAERRKRNGLQRNTLRGLELFGRISGFPVKSLGLVQGTL